MPRIFAHPAVILPLPKLGSTRVMLAGLVLGSLISDLGYYIRRFDFASYAHTVADVFFFCLPTVVLLARFLVHCRQFLQAPLPPKSGKSGPPLPEALLASTPSSEDGNIRNHGCRPPLAWNAFTQVNAPAVKTLPLSRKVVLVFVPLPRVQTTTTFQPPAWAVDSLHCLQQPVYSC